MILTGLKHSAALAIRRGYGGRRDTSNSQGFGGHNIVDGGIYLLVIILHFIFTLYGLIFLIF